MKNEAGSTVKRKGARGAHVVLGGSSASSPDRESTVGTIPMVRLADIILAVVLVAVGFVFSFFVSFGGSEGKQVRVTVAGESYGIYSLQEDSEVVVKPRGKRQNSAAGQGVADDAGQGAADNAGQGAADNAGASNCFRIMGGKVKMIDTNCRGGDCLHEGEISKTGETIICLPNKVVIEIIGVKEDFDAVSK